MTTRDTTRMGAVSGGSAKFNTAPIPAEPVTPKLWVYLYLCRTLTVTNGLVTCSQVVSGYWLFSG